MRSLSRTALGLIAVVLLLGGAIPSQAAPPIIPASLLSVSRPPSTYNTKHVFVANTPRTITVPDAVALGASAPVLAILSPDSGCPDLYVSTTGTADAAAVDVTDGTASDHNPPALRFALTSPPLTFSVETPTACILTIAWYLQRAP